MAQKYLQKHQLQQEHKQMLQRATQMALQQDRQRVRRRRMARPQPGAPVIKRPRGGESQESGEDHGDQGKDEGKKPELAHVGHSLCLYSVKHVLFLCPPPPQIEWSGAYCFCPVCLFVCLSVCLSVVNFNICYNFWTVRGRDFIFGMHTPLMMPFQMTPQCSKLWLNWSHMRLKSWFCDLNLKKELAKSQP